MYLCLLRIERHVDFEKNLNLTGVDDGPIFPTRSEAESFWIRYDAQRIGTYTQPSDRISAFSNASARYVKATYLLAVRTVVTVRVDV